MDITQPLCWVDIISLESPALVAFLTPLLGGVVLGSHSEVVCAAGASLVVIPYAGIKFPSYNGGFQLGHCLLWWHWVRGQSVGWNEQRNGENEP